MTDQATTAAVSYAVTVPLSREQAFHLFVEEHGSWWPRESHHIGDGPATAVLEPRKGGRWYERADADASECDWGRVLAYEPPERIVLAWQLLPDFSYDPDPARQTEVEVSFEAEGEDSTRVTLEHRGFEVHGEAGGPMRDAVGGDNGWPGLLALYEQAARS